MVRVRLLTSIAGVDAAYDYGQVIPLAVETARAWIAEGLAEAVDALPGPESAGAVHAVPVETAVTEPPEAMIRRRGRRR